MTMAYHFHEQYGVYGGQFIAPNDDAAVTIAAAHCYQFVYREATRAEGMETGDIYTVVHRDLSLS
jgi:hypothetical protein